jgi:hypothetical protein
MAFTTVGMATIMRIAFWMALAPLASADFWSNTERVNYASPCPVL